MQFFNREKELELFRNIEAKSATAAQMTVLVGRRRIGKTRLLKKSAEGSKFVYFFVSRKNESLLCEEFEAIIKTTLNVDIYGSLRSFKDVFGFLMDLSHRLSFTLIIDEFQEFLNINPSVFSEMQNIWDSKKDNSTLNLILCGSVYSLMTRIFEHSKEPLFGRATGRVHLKPFTVATLKEIMRAYNSGYTKEDLLAFYLFTGGVAKYVELLVQAGAFSFKSMMDEILSAGSVFIEEGKNVLIDEFGRDYGNYFSILSLMAYSKTSRSEIESVLKMETGGFLNRLEVDFGIIEKIRPINAKPGARNVKYYIRDNFLNFWFRFIYKNSSALEIANYDYVKTIVARDFPTFSGRFLERYFSELLALDGDWSQVGAYWERGNLNDIDIVALNHLDRKILICEVKRNAEKLNINDLKSKSQNLLREFENYDVEFKGLSIEDM
jgi:uncharacterized protein